MKKIIRITTIGASLDILLKGQLKFLSKNFEILAVSGADEHLENVKNREGVRTFSVPMQRKISPFNDLVSLWQLYLLFRREKPDIVHSMTPKAGLLSMTAARFANVPIRIHTFTGLIFPSKSGILQKILIKMDKVLCHFATVVYPEGNGVKNDLHRFKITQKPLKVIANGNVNGVDCNYFNSELFSDTDNESLKSNFKISNDDFIYVFVGRLVGDKGINELTSAFTKITEQYNNITLLLVGGFENDLDPLLPETERLLRSNKKIVSVGFQSDIRPFLAVADALIFPSYREGFPNVVLQAGAMGLPSIVTNINGCNEIIENGTNGIIIPVHDENAIYASMIRFVEDEKLLFDLKKNTRPTIQKKFDQKEVWNAILAEYQNLLKI